MNDIVGALGGVETILVLGGIGFLIYYFGSHPTPDWLKNLFPKPTSPVCAPPAGQTPVTTTSSCVSYFQQIGGSHAITVMLNGVPTTFGLDAPVGPSGQTVGQLMAQPYNWSTDQVANYISMSTVTG